MSKVIFKLKFQSPNLKNTKMNNMYHLLYIGTREGVELNDDMKMLDEKQNKTSNEEYLKYISDRPRSHGLFGKDDKPINIQQLANEMKEFDGYVYRGIISLRESDAIEKGYDNKEKWKDLIKDKMFYISKQLKIPYNQLKWVGAFHRESGHPHVHVMMWNKDKEVRNIGVIDTKNIENIRKSLTSAIFSEEREEILLEKNMLRDILIEKSKDLNISGSNISERMKKLQETYEESELELNSLEELSKFEIGDKITNNSIKEIGKMLKGLNIPSTGRIQYKFMPPEVKKEIDKITDKILSIPSFNRAFNDYLESVEKYTRLYTEKEEDIESSITNAKIDIYHRIGNNVLKSKKEMIYENNNEKFEKARLNYITQNMLNSMFKMLSTKENQMKNKNLIIGRSKAENRKKAQENKAKGLYSIEELQ